MRFCIICEQQVRADQCVACFPSAAIRDIDLIAADITNWADQAFPARTDTSMFLKLYSEIAEMIDADDANTGDEIADVLIMVLDYAKRRNIQIADVIQKKMEPEHRDAANSFVAALCSYYEDLGKEED